MLAWEFVMIGEELYSARCGIVNTAASYSELITQQRLIKPDLEQGLCNAETLPHHAPAKLLGELCFDPGARRAFA